MRIKNGHVEMTPDDAPKMYEGERITLYGAAVWFLMSAYSYSEKVESPMWVGRSVANFLEATGLRKPWIETATENDG